MVRFSGFSRQKGSGVNSPDSLDMYSWISVEALVLGQLRIRESFVSLAGKEVIYSVWHMETNFLP